MKKYTVLSTICLGIYILLYSLIMNGISFGSLGKTVIISMFIFPLLGFVFGIKSKKGIGKWLLLILNLISLITIAYLLALGSGISEA